MLPTFVRDRYLRRALVLWVILAIALGIRTAHLGGTHSVFPQFAAASRHWWADKSLYVSYWFEEGIDGYRYSPTFAVAFTPFASLPQRWGAILWGIVTIAILVCALHAFVRDVLPGRWTTRREGLFLSLALAGFAVGIWSGQSNAFVSALVMLAMSAIVRQRWWTAAGLLSVPVLVKLWPIAVVMLLVACWPRQLTLRFLAVSLLLAAAPFLTRPFGTVCWQYHEWYVCLTGPLQDRWPGYRDAWTIWNSIWPPVNDRVYTALQLGAAAAVLVWCLWQRRRLLGWGNVFRVTNPGAAAVTPSNSDLSLLPRTSSPQTGHLLTLIYAMWASWQLLLGPGSEQLTYGLLAPATSWAVLASFAAKKARWLTVLVWATSALLASGDVEHAVLAVCSRGQILLPLSVVLFVVWLVWHERGPVRLADCRSQNT